MTDTAAPLPLAPRYIPRPWGGRRLAELYGRLLPGDGPIGESWELYDRPDGSSVLAHGPLAGRPLAALRGPRPIPLFTKIVDARETLSLQVHPDAEAADELSSEEKNEAWFVLHADPGARIFRGLLPAVRAPDLLRALDAGTVMDLVHSFAPKAGDVVFVPAGTVHALGGGLVVYEIQQNSDTTYRLYDHGRVGLDGKPRAIHRHEAVRCADFTGPGKDVVAPVPVLDEDNLLRTIRLETAHFVLEEQEVHGVATFETERRGRERWHSLFVAEGEGTVRPFRRGAGEIFFAPGDSLILPAGHAAYEVAVRAGHPARLLTTWVP